MPIRLINSLFTMGIGLALACMYLRKTMRFISLATWSIAFMLYGFEILLRVWYTWNAIEVFILSVMMSPLFILGTSNLMRRNRIYFIVCLILLPIVILEFPSGNWHRIGSFMFFGLMTMAVIHLRLSVGKVADRFILGWLALLVSNVLFVSILPLEWMADLAAIPAKSILALGMLDQRFARMVIDIKRIYKGYRLAGGGIETQRSKE